MTPSMGDTRMKKNVAEFTKNPGQHDVGKWELRSYDGTTADSAACVTGLKH